MNDHELLFHYINLDDIYNFKLIAKKYSSVEIYSIFSDKEHLSLIHWCVLNNSLSILLWLLDVSNYSTDLANNPNMWTPAHIAAMKGHDVCLEVLLKRIPNIKNKLDKKDRLPLHIAASHGHTHCLHLLLGATSHANTMINQVAKSPPQWTPLMYAVWHGRISSTEILIRHGASTDLTDENGMTLLHLAASEGHDDLVKYLVKEGSLKEVPECLVAVDNSGRTPFHLALEYHKFSTAQLIQQAIEDPVTWESARKLAYPGHICALDNDIVKLKCLLEHGSINLNDSDDRGYTMLHKAAAAGSVEVMQYLLEKGANVLVRTMGRETCRDIAVRKSNSKIVDLIDGQIKKMVSGSDKLAKLNSMRGNLDCDLEQPDFEKWLKSVSDKEDELTSLQKIYQETVGEYDEEDSHEGGSDLSSNKQRKLYKAISLNYKIALIKFNLYLLKETATDQEIELARVLADCEHQYEEVSDQLQYEREVRENLQAEMTSIRQNVLKIQKWICDHSDFNWMVPNELFQLVMFDSKRESSHDNNKSDNQDGKERCGTTKKFSVHFCLNTRTNCISIVRILSTPPTKLSNEHLSDLTDITKIQFIKYIRTLIDYPGKKTKNSNKKLIKRRRRLKSPIGGIFIETNY